MPNPSTLPPADYLHACFDYNPETGEFRWRRRPLEHFASPRAEARWNARYAGAIVGIIDYRGSHRFRFGRRNYKIHRIIFKMMTGEEPPATIDHRDGNPSNNRWTNLRPATQVQQIYNASLRSDNSSGHRGVTWDRENRKWIAQININGRHHNLGRFISVEEAAAAYETAARKAFGEFYRER